MRPGAAVAAPGLLFMHDCGPPIQAIARSKIRSLAGRKQHDRAKLIIVRSPLLVHNLILAWLEPEEHNPPLRAQEQSLDNEF